MLKLYNSMTRCKQEFQPRHEDGVVRIFTCGPSTYRRPHIGNYRSFLYQDILVRYLEFHGYPVSRIINFTDIEDKALQESLEQGRRVEEITADVADHFHRETQLLRIKLPPHIPRSSTSVDQAVKLIKMLVDKGYAYWYKGSVFFDPLRFKGFGKLFRLDMSRWPKQKVRFKRDTYNGRRWNLGDFILWHGENSKNHELHATAAWDTEIGRGRPSWNIQDPAIITKHLGYTVDINCGGIDNIYRHHDYNIAVIESLSGKAYAGFYLHGEHLVVNGKPMSKSVGNILYAEDIVKEGFKAHHLRFFLIYTHYRAKLNYTPARFAVSSALIDGIRTRIQELTDGSYLSQIPDNPAVTKTAKALLPLYENVETEKLPSQIETVFRLQMDNDLGIGSAIDHIHAILLELSRRDRISSLTSRVRDELLKDITAVDAVSRILL